MRMSCNGCRVLRKGCSENCIIRPCLQWIKSSESQANATVFLAKFYGRAGLVNLISSGPAHLRPAVFRSLLYEACGRVVNPIYGSVGLLSSNKWSSCQSAVDAVLCGASIDRITLEDEAVQPLETCDIRHVGKVVGGDKNRTRFRRCIKKMNEPDQVSKRMKSMESSVSADSGETVDASHVVGSVEPVGEIELELRLGVEPVSKGSKPTWNETTLNDRCHDGRGLELNFCG